MLVFQVRIQDFLDLFSSISTAWIKAKEDKKMWKNLKGGFGESYKNFSRHTMVSKGFLKSQLIPFVHTFNAFLVCPLNLTWMPFSTHDWNTEASISKKKIVWMICFKITCLNNQNLNWWKMLNPSNWTRVSLLFWRATTKTHYCAKGQIISKGLEFSQKMNEQIHHSSNLWENLRVPKVLSKLSDL